MEMNSSICDLGLKGKGLDFRFWILEFGFKKKRQMSRKILVSKLREFIGIKALAGGDKPHKR